MKHALLPFLLATSTIANAQFLNSDARIEQLGLRSGTVYWWSNSRSKVSRPGLDEAIYYRREHKHWALEVSAAYSNYSRPLDYYATYLDAPGLVVAYDREHISAYTSQISLQYLLINTDRSRVYMGAIAQPAYYYYKIHKVPDTDGGSEDGGAILLGAGVNCMWEYSLSSNLAASVTLQQTYLPSSDETFDRIHSTPEYKTSLLIGLAYCL